MRATKGQKPHPPKLAWLTKVIILIKRCLKLMMAGHHGSLLLLHMHSAVIAYTGQKVDIGWTYVDRIWSEVRRNSILTSHVFTASMVLLYS